MWAIMDMVATWVAAADLAAVISPQTCESALDVALTPLVLRVFRVCV